MLKHGFWRGSLKDSPSEVRILRLQVMVSGRLFLEDIESTGRLCHCLDSTWFEPSLPSGNRLHNYGKIHHAINGKSNYFYGHFQ